jgi:hypothetical protein
MKKTILFIVTVLISVSISGQEVKKTLLKSFYDDFLTYGTLYAAGDVSNSIEASESTYFVRTGENGSLYDIPVVVDNTPKYLFDYRIGIGIRKLARFNYERKPRNYYDGTEEQLAFSAPTSAFKGLEYQIHFEKERWRGEEFQNHNLFIKHTGKNHIFKIQSREVDKIGLKFFSVEARARLPIGEKFSVSAGVIARGHERAYGYNPIEIWLNETDEFDNPINPWYTLGFQYGYTDHYTTYTDVYSGQEVGDWIWKDENGEIVAHTDLEFREQVFTELMNRYNQERWNGLAEFGEIAPIVGADYYHNKGKFWLHAYANYILPYHQYIQGNKRISYLNRNNWGKGGLPRDAKPEQWEDYSAGLSVGWKLNKSLGIFAEGEYSKMWDSELFQTTFGVNFTFK